MALDPALHATLARISTGTVTTVLLKKGLRNVWMRGPLPFTPAARSGRRLVGPAFTLRFVPAREDLATPESWSSPISTRAAIEAMPEGCIAVRDVVGVNVTGMPVWCRGGAAPPSVAGLTFVGWGEPIGCGGVAVFPDDVIVCDDDGAVVIPKALVAEVAATGEEQERLEAWIVARVEAGATLPGLYPPNAENRARYEAERGR